MTVRTGGHFYLTFLPRSHTKRSQWEISLWEWCRNFEKAPRFGAGKWSFHDILANAADKICPILEKLQTQALNKSFFLNYIVGKMAIKCNAIANLRGFGMSPLGKTGVPTASRYVCPVARGHIQPVYGLVAAITDRPLGGYR